MAEDQLTREDVIDAIEDALDQRAYEDGLTLCELLLRTDPGDPDVLVLKGELLADCGAFEQALDLFERAHEEVPSWQDGELMRGGMLLELGRLPEAARLLDAAITREPERADLRYSRAIVFELAGDDLGAQRYYRQAEGLDPSRPAPLRVSNDLFMSVAKAALDEFPAEIMAVFDNVDVFVRDLPDPAQIGGGAPLSMLVLGYFDGTPRAYRSTEDPFSHMPSQVFLFKRNHERICRTMAELREQVAITLRHELGHYLGLDEDDMERLGLD